MKKIYLLITLIYLSLNTLTAQVLYEDFEIWPPVNWVLEPVSGTGSWVQNNGDVPTGGGNAGPGSAYEGEFAAMYNNYDYIPEVTGSMTSPAFDLSPLEIPMLKFFWWNNDAPLEPALIIVQNSADGINFSTLDTIEAKQSGEEWVEYYHLLDENTSYIKIIGVSDYGLKNTYIDAFEISEAPNCLQPNSLSTTDINPTSVTVDWNNGNDEEAWIVEFGLQGFELGTGTQIYTDEHPITIEELNSNTNYEVYVQSDCDSETSPWTEALAFSTSCETIEILPWEEGFENGNLGCFQVNQFNPAETWYWTNDGGFLGPQAGEGYARIAYSLSPQDEWLVSPVFDFTAFQPTVLSFWWALNYNLSVVNDSYDLILKVTTDGENWTNIWDETMEGVFENWVYYQTQIDLTDYYGEDNFQFAFNYVGTDGAAAYLDEVVVDIEVGTKDEIYTSEISLYPNPANEYLNIRSINDIYSIQIFNSFGQLIKSIESIYSSSQSIDLKDINNGYYLLKVKTKNGSTTEPIQIIR